MNGALVLIRHLTLADAELYREIRLEALQLNPRHSAVLSRRKIFAH